jgi:hypothetical protein
MKVFIGPYPDDDSLHTEQEVCVKIDYYDTWNMDGTLALIALPMLNQLKETKQGSPFVDDEDVPHLPKKGVASNESMQYDLFQSEKHDELIWEQLHERWSWVLNEIIFAFESKVGWNKEWDSRYWYGESDICWEKVEDGMSEMKKGPNHTRVWDKEGYFKEADRIANGFRLFGKYYQGLWD